MLEIIIVIIVDVRDVTIAKGNAGPGEPGIEGREFGACIGEGDAPGAVAAPRDDEVHGHLLDARAALRVLSCGLARGLECHKGRRISLPWGGVARRGLYATARRRPVLRVECVRCERERRGPQGRQARRKQ